MWGYGREISGWGGFGGVVGLRDLDWEGSVGRDAGRVCGLEEGKRGW